MLVSNVIGAPRTRNLAMLAALVCLLSLGSVLGKASQAEAAVARPTLKASAVKAGVVTLSGRAPNAVRVALQRRTGTGWVTLRYLNAPSHVFSTRVLVGARPKTYRAATWSGSSTAVVVRPTRPTLRASAVRSGQATLRGYTPRATVRVALQRRQGTSWVRVRYLTTRRHAVTTSVPVARKTSFRLATRSRRSTPVVVAPKWSTQTDACGARPTKANGALWSCSFVDDFNGTMLDRTKWAPQHNYSPGNAANWSCHQDSPENVSVGDGMLSLTLRKGAQQTCGAYRSGETTPYTSGQVSTYDRFSQAYGRFEARIRNTKTSEPGLHEAFWMWPDVRYGEANNWPETGEIDIVETYSAASNRGLPYLHYTANDNGGPSTVGPNANTSHSCYAERGMFNTWALEWSPTKIQVFVNGKLCFTNTSGDPAFDKRYIMLLTQGMGWRGNSFTGNAPIPATMDVDYVRAWK